MRSWISDKDITRLIDEVDEIVSQVKDDSPISLPDEIASLIRTAFSNFLPGDDLAGEIMRCFGIDETGRLIRHGSKKSAKITLSPASSEAGTTTVHCINSLLQKRLLPLQFPIRLCRSEKTLLRSISKPHPK